MNDQLTTTRTVINDNSPVVPINPVSTATPQVSVQKEIISQESTSDQALYRTEKINQIIWFIIGIIELLIIARFLLILLGARNVEFVSFIYSLSRIFILPFVGIFASPALNGTSYFESASIVGFIFWLLIGFGITYLITILSTSNNRVTNY